MENEKDEEGGRSGVQSVETAAEILRAMTEVGRPASLKDLSAAAGMHPGKVHRYLVSLTRSGLVTQDALSGRYGVGPTAIALGLSGLRNVDVVREASAVLPQVRDETGETALLALWTGSAPVVFMLEESSRPVFMNVRVGSVLPLMATATGRIFAAYLPSAEIEPLLTKEAAAAPQLQSEPYEPSKIEAVLADVRASGIAAIEGTLVPGVCALAAPIFDHRGRAIAAIGALGRTEEMDATSNSPVARCLIEAAAVISKKLGYRH
jgi:DNA-binding IclR family transcriptional regulator